MYSFRETFTSWVMIHINAHYILYYHVFFHITQELAHVFGGKVAPGLKREYGKASVSRVEGCNSPLFAGLPEEFIMWMSHGDKLHEVPEGFTKCGE